MDGKPRVLHKRREQQAASITKGRVLTSTSSSSTSSSPPQRTATSSHHHIAADATPEQDGDMVDKDDGLRDDYIALNCKSRRKLTSRSTLAELPLLTPKVISDLIRGDGNHAKERAKLLASYECSFKCWFKQALAGFNLIFYGYGSKKVLLERFGATTIAAEQGHPFIVVNGFFSSLSLKHILESILSVYIDTNDPLKQCAFIEEVLEQQPDTHVFMILHNIDGEALRAPQTQAILSRLAAIEQIHIFASVDDINAMLQWDHCLLGNFKWLWHHTPTFETYENELLFQTQKIMCDGTQGTVSTRSASLVLKNLTKPARDTFRFLANAHLQSKPPMSLKELFSAQVSKECFASSEQELDKYIKEMWERKIVRTTIRRADGSLVLALALEAAALRQILEDLGTE